MAVVHVTAESFEAEVLNSDKPVLVDFWADWCGPCKMLGPVVEQFADEHEEYKVCKVDVDANPELALKYKVVSIPMLLVFEKGEIKNKSIGAVPKSAILDLFK
jgi:thioredoxin 1